MNSTVTPVPIGLQTIAGYAAFLAGFLTPIIATAAGYATVMHVPNWLFPVLGSVLLAVTNYGRSNQAASLNQNVTPPVTPAPVTMSSVTPDTLASAQAIVDAAVQSGVNTPTPA